MAVSACSRAMIGAGVPAGASSPYHCSVVVCNSGFRDGRDIGQSLDAGLEPGHRKPRNVPASTCGLVVKTPAIKILTCPATRSLRAGPTPR